MEDRDTSLKTTPLEAKHIALGAKMVPFSGWNMPLQYTGIIDEHMHTREKAGLFDVCHMGELFLKGERAEEAVSRLVTCRTLDMPEGKCRYAFMLNDKGGIVDDLIVFKISEKEFMLVVNAGTTDKDSGWIRKNIEEGVSFFDDSKNIAKLDLQGPLSGEVIAAVSSGEEVKTLKRFTFTKVDIDGVKVLVSRTGYTGEVGYELFFPQEMAGRMWDLLLENKDVKPVGLGARDTLRLEVGYSLYGSDIDEDHSPLEANLERFVYMGKDFIGKEALLREAEEGTERILTGFVCEGRRSARGGFKVLANFGEAGVVTSGAFSPCLKKGIGLCYINRDLAGEGKSVILTDGKVEIEAQLKDVPILEK